MRDLFIKCPFHEGDRTPSLSILLQNKGNLKAGFAHCFGCGWSGNYLQVEEQLGHPLPLPPQVRDMLKNSKGAISCRSTRLRSHTESVAAVQKTYKQEIPYKFSPYLYSRRIQKVIQEFNKVYEAEGSVYMPFFSPQDEYLGHVERGTSGNKFYKVSGSIKYPIGIESISPKDFVYVTEGQIDKMSLEECGFKAVALGSVSNYRLLRFIKNLNICIAFDNDSAGEKGTEVAYNYMKGRGKNLYFLTLPQEVKDINELLVKSTTYEEVSDWVKRYTRRFL